MAAVADLLSQMWDLLEAEATQLLQVIAVIAVATPAAADGWL